MRFVANLTDTEYLALQIGATFDSDLFRDFRPSIDTNDSNEFSEWIRNLRGLEEAANAQSMEYSDAAIAAKQAAKDGNWVLFSKAIGSMKEPPIKLIELLNECFGYFLESGNISDSKVLADKLLGYSGRGERERKIFEKQGTDLDRITGVLARSDLSSEDFRHLGSVAISSPQIREDFIDAVNRDCGKPRMCWVAPLGMRALLQDNFNDPERFPIALGLLNSTLKSPGIVKTLIDEGIKYNRVAFDQDNLKLAFDSIKDYEPEGKKESFEWHLFKARAKVHLGESYQDHIEKAYELANECSWAHSRYVSTTRQAAINQVNSLVEELKL